MIRTAPCAVLMLFLLFHAGTAAAGEIERLSAENALLETEIKLARKQSIYFVFDIANSTIYLKARGVAYREFPVLKRGFWGTFSLEKPYTLLKRTALLSPEREKIKPGKKEGADAFDLQALEIRDMPRNFRLVFDGGMVVHVRTVNEGIFFFARRIVFLQRWQVFQPLHTVWNALFKKPYTGLYVMMKEEDVKSLYWSMYEGVQAIVSPVVK